MDLNDEILKLLCKIQTGSELPPPISYQELSELPDRSQKIIIISPLGKNSLSEARRALLNQGRLYFYLRGWCLKKYYLLRKQGFKDIRIYRLINKGYYLVDLLQTITTLSSIKDYLFRSHLFLHVMKIVPGNFFFSAGLEEIGLDIIFMKINHRSILAMLSRYGNQRPYHFIKTSRVSLGSDYPRKENFILDWLSTSNGIGLPEYQFDDKSGSTLSMNRCNGVIFSMPLNQIKNPNKETMVKIKRVRNALERLSMVPAPDKTKCREFLDMLYDQPYLTRRKQFRDIDDYNQQCIVHGDLNPKNIIIGDETIYFVDWEHWRIGKRFENWFDFLIRTIYIAIRRHKLNTPGYILYQYRRLFLAPWMRDETNRFFVNCGIELDLNICLRYSLFLFFSDRIIKMDPNKLKKKLEKIRFSNRYCSKPR